MKSLGKHIISTVPVKSSSSNFTIGSPEFFATSLFKFFIIPINRIFVNFPIFLLFLDLSRSEIFICSIISRSTFFESKGCAETYMPKYSFSYFSIKFCGNSSVFVKLNSLILSLFPPKRIN